MALTLDPTLATAQDSASRHPLVEIISQNPAPDIPFVGNFLDALLVDEEKPNIITHSTGRICATHIHETTKLRYVYTDTERTQFYFETFQDSDSWPILEATLYELTSGNIGVAFLSSSGGNNRLRYFVISPTGTVVVAQTTIVTYATATTTISSPFLTKVGANYFLAYVTNSSGNYAVKKRTSADFLTWSAEGDCSIGGLTATKRIANLSLLVISTGQIWLWFDYLDEADGGMEIVNLYYSTSDDSGATWANAVKFTSYTTYETSGKHPFVVQKVATQMHLIFQEVASLIRMDDSTDGWTPAEEHVQKIQIDEVENKMYLTILIDPSTDWPQLWGIVKVDIATWTIDKCWTPSSVPALPAHWCNLSGDMIYRTSIPVHGERHLVPVISQDDDNMNILLLDGEADSIFVYHFHNKPAFTPAVTQNVTWSMNSNNIKGVWIDYDSSRMYVLFSKYVFGGTCYYSLGYFDLTEATETKTLNTIFEEDDIGWYEMAYVFLRHRMFMEIVPDEDLLILYLGYPNFLYGAISVYGHTRIHILSTGAIYKDYAYHAVDCPNYPSLGIINGQYYDGKIWCTYDPHYDVYGGSIHATYLANNWDGFCTIEPSTDTITHFRPAWSPLAFPLHYGSTGAYQWMRKFAYGKVVVAEDKNKVVFGLAGFGMGVYDITSDTWNLYDDESIPGLDNNGGYGDFLYYDYNEMIYIGYDKGLLGFLIDGLLSTIYYQEGNYDGSWDWETKAQLCYGYQDSDAVVCLNPDDQSFFAFWQHQITSGNKKIKWGMETTELDLAPYVVRNKELAAHWSISGDPSELSFAVSHGHLFDPFNTSSLLRIFLAKGRKLVMRFGEDVAGTPYMHAQGSFLVNETSLKYRRGEYPQMDVLARDRRCYWEYADIFATTYFQDYPEDILDDVLQNFLDFDAGDIDIPEMYGRTLIYQQWVGVKAKEIVDQICDRFFSFHRMTVDDKFTVKRISNGSAVDHVYSDLAQMIEYTPDDTFSDFTNRVVVIGFGRTDLAVTYDEERVGSLNGTCGWWGFKQDFTIRYSEDESRVCLSPRLVVLESSQSIAFQLAGQVHEEISYVDPNNLYCVITVTAPNLIPALLAGITILAVYALIPDWVASLGVGATTPYGRVIHNLGLMLVLMILSSVGNFQYEVWARPRGYVKQTVQAEAEDEDLQRQIGAVVTHKLEDPLCYTHEVCQAVADHEMMIVKNQRRRVRFTKIAHLQDEVGDMIQIPHPYTGEAMKIFITELTRKMKIPEEEGADGYFLDEIEGWVIPAE